ncbi:hypothetical protein ACDI35_10675 [Xanthomonas axonopodis pv. cajani]|uniref:hypothetical protein n=1 Tax=Xanthomonas axonopodis TaxID=53413 RepID=UPI003556EB76
MKEEKNSILARSCCFIDVPVNAKGAVGLVNEVIRAASYFIDGTGLRWEHLCHEVAPDLTPGQLSDLVMWVSQFFPEEGVVSDVHAWFVQSPLVELQNQAFSYSEWKSWTLIERSWEPLEVHLTLMQVRGALSPVVAFRDVLRCSAHRVGREDADHWSAEDLSIEQGAAMEKSIDVARCLLDAFIIGEGHGIWAKLDDWRLHHTNLGEKNFISSSLLCSPLPSQSA